MGEWTFEALRRELKVPVAVLEEDLQHLERSRRKEPERLRSTPARCSACGFTFADRVPRRFTTPGRCPRCRDPRVTPARFWVS
jgi:hypothetical protein